MDDEESYYKYMEENPDAGMCSDYFREYLSLTNGILMIGTISTTLNRHDFYDKSIKPYSFYI